jgi:hypothetical protein
MSAERYHLWHVQEHQVYILHILNAAWNGLRAIACPSIDGMIKKNRQQNLSS